MVELNHKRLGKIYILKEDKGFEYVLLFAPEYEQFIVAHELDKETGIWIDGHYYGMNLILVIREYMMLYKELKKSGD